MTRLHIFLFSVGTISLFGALACQDAPYTRKNTSNSFDGKGCGPRLSETTAISAVSPKTKTADQNAPKDATDRKPHLREATQAEVLKLRRAGAVLRARVYHNQGTIQLPRNFPRVVGALFLGSEHAKLVGVEVFKGLNQLKRAPGHYFARIRYITLAGRRALKPSSVCS